MSPRSRLAVAFVSTGVVGYIFLGSVLGRVFGDSTYGQLAVFNEVVRMVLDAYVEPVNLDRTMAGARLGMADALDGDSAYLDAEEFRTYQQGKQLDGDVGLLLSRRYTFLAVVAARPGSPAEKAGVHSGDIIKTIDGRHTRTIAPQTGQRLLQGAPGSVVKLTLLRAGTDPVDVSVTRERVAAAAPQARMVEAGTGYLKVPEVSSRTAEEVKGELESLRKQGARRLVLDLRDSAYGAPADGVKLAELFLKGGVVTRLSGRKHAEQVFSAEASRNAWREPLAVLVDSGTAGPAEVAAAALLEGGRGPVVGEHTFGRAPLQQAIPLETGGLVLTVATFHTPKGEPIHDKGIEPSVKVQAKPEDSEADAPAADAILDKALELLKAEPAKAA